MVRASTVVYKKLTSASCYNRRDIGRSAYFQHTRFLTYERVRFQRTVAQSICM